MHDLSAVDWNILYPEEEQKKRLHFNYYARKHEDSLGELRKVTRYLARISRAGAGKGSPAGRRKRSVSDAGYRFASTRRQYSVVKFSYGKSWRGHLQFLNCYLAQKNKDVGKKPEIFGNISAERYKKKMADVSYKWIISPESFLSEKELRELAGRMVARMEGRLGRHLDWQAAVHQDTGHPHVHILLNGVDSEGRRYRFPKDFIRTGCRHWCQDILTQMKGGRSEEQVMAARRRGLSAVRLTEYDDIIEGMLLPCQEGEGAAGMIHADDGRLTPELRLRLDSLKDMGLACTRDGSYYLAESWREDLRTAGRYNTFLDARSLFEEDGGELHEFRHSYGAVCRGRVRKIYLMNDENVWSNALVIQDADGSGWFIPVWDASVLDPLVEGLDVTVKAYGRNGKRSIGIYINNIVRKDYSSKEDGRLTPPQTESPEGQQAQLEELEALAGKDKADSSTKRNRDEGIRR